MRISNQSDIEDGLRQLLEADRRLMPVYEAAGTVPLRLAAPDFSGLASIIISQQVSKASAEAIYGRLSRLTAPLCAQTILGADDKIFREAGVSRPKQATLLAIAMSVDRGELDLAGLCHVAADEAITELVQIKGVGPWTAEIYLMFCAGHRDIFPAGDLALQEAVKSGIGLAERPSPKELRAIAEAWAPWRSIASRLFWAYYSTLRAGREILPV